MEQSEKLFEFIINHIRDNGYQPSFQEMADCLECSENNAQYILKKIEETGMVRLTGKERAVSITGLRWVEQREIEWAIPPKETAILDAVRGYLSLRGYQPTVNEIAEMTGISRVTVMKKIANLVKMGVIENTGSGRALKLIGSKWYPEKSNVAL